MPEKRFGFRKRSRTTDHVNPAVQLEEARQAVEDNRMIVDDDGPNCSHNNAQNILREPNCRLTLPLELCYFTRICVLSPSPARVILWGREPSEPYFKQSALGLCGLETHGSANLLGRFVQAG